MKQKLGKLLLVLCLLFVTGYLQYQEVCQTIVTEYTNARRKNRSDSKNGLETQEEIKENSSTQEEIKENSSAQEEQLNNSPNLGLYALSACLMDASNGRVLYSKDAYKEMPMASTTKIMTLLVVLENADLDTEIVTVSTNAAKQPDVQLNINTGEQYYLKDLVYSLMLESHNDCAVAIAEHVGGSVESFCEMMTAKAKAIGAMHTSYKTPNGLDADDHYTTASDLALIGSYAIQNEEFIKITNTQTYQFNEITTGRSFTVNNKNRFLAMMDGAIGIKTGFTGKAGYCFVGAIKKSDGRKFVSVVLGSGWPPNKNYKWTDTRKLMELGLENYTEQVIFSPIEEYQSVFIKNGIETEVMTSIEAEVSLLLCEQDKIEIKPQIPSELNAPIHKQETIGTIEIYINGLLYKTLPVIAKTQARELNYDYCIKKIMEWFFFR